jgi:hypothetical protein
MVCTHGLIILVPSTGLNLWPLRMKLVTSESGFPEWFRGFLSGCVTPSGDFLTCLRNAFRRSGSLCVTLNKTGTCPQILVKRRIIQFHKILSVVLAVFHANLKKPGSIDVAKLRGACLQLLFLNASRNEKLQQKAHIYRCVVCYFADVSSVDASFLYNKSVMTPNNTAWLFSASQIMFSWISLDVCYNENHLK